MGVHKKFSNLVCYEDTGRFPLAVFMAKQIFSCYKRLNQMEAVGANSIARHAVSEQRLSQLTSDLVPENKGCLLSPDILETSPAIVKRLRTLFHEVWKQAVENSA